MSDTAFTAFLGDFEHRFDLRGKHVAELERLSGTGIGTIFKRLTEGHYRHADIRHVISLALIGSGEMTPKLASAFCDVWVTDRPILESYPVALSILERLWFGAPVVEALIAEVTKDASDAA